MSRYLLLLASLLLVFLSRVEAGAPASSPGEPPGGIRPLTVELDGRWIGNAVSYSPYRRNQSPWGPFPTSDQILEDLRLVARHWNLIRLYSSAPETERTLNVIRDHHLPLRVVLGAWISPETSGDARAANQREVASAIRLARAHPGIVIAVNVGNETQVHWSGHRTDPALLIAYIREARAAITQPVTTADDFRYWITPESRAVAGEIDFVMTHGYALWNGRSLEEAMTWTAGIYDSVCRMHPDRLVVIGETGWATSRDPWKKGPGGEGVIMKAEASLAAQLEYLRQHEDWVESRRVVTFLFEAFDERWKGGGPQGSLIEAEKHWGVFTDDRRPKPSYLTLLRERKPALALLYVERPLVIGHRGFARTAPENTLPAFEQALAAGVDMVELDYHHSRDGKPVVFHDGTLDRTTNALARWGGKDIRVSERTAAELATLDAGSWFDPGFAGTHVPLLTEALEAIQRSSVTLIERKAGDAATLARILRERGLVNRVVVQSFDWDFLRELHALLPEQVLGALGPHDRRAGRAVTPKEKTLDAAWLDALADTGAAIVAWNAELDGDSVRLAHARGLRLFAYTIDDAPTAVRLRALGVHGIITNDPALVQKALSESVAAQVTRQSGGGLGPDCLLTSAATRLAAARSAATTSAAATTDRQNLPVARDFTP